MLGNILEASSHKSGSGRYKLDILPTMLHKPDDPDSRGHHSKRQESLDGDDLQVQAMEP